MDLRPFLTDPKLFNDGIELIRQGVVFYQPLILAEGVEVGEGQNIENNYAGCESTLDWNVYLAPAYRHLWNDPTRKLAEDPIRFSFCNQKYRLCYERVTNTITDAFEGKIESLSVLEIGCNTGLNLFYLARKGARYCLGVDWTDYSYAFLWLNRTLGTAVHFRRGVYDNLQHRMDIEIREFDVVVNTVFINHQSDPLHFLCYLADRARRALLLWVLLDEFQDRLAILYTPVSGVHDLGGTRPFPLSLHNGVSMTRALFVHALQQLGFDDVQFIAQPTDPNLSPPTGLRPFSLVIANRTRDVKSALWEKWEADGSA